MERRAQTLRQLVEAAADLGACRGARARGEVPLERAGVQQYERAFGQRWLVARLPQVVEQWQQRQRDVLAAAEQPLEVRRQLHHGARQRFDPLLGLLIVLGLGQAPAGLLHFFGQQRGAVNLDDLQRAACDVQIFRGAQQRVGAGAAVDVVLELAARGVERARELAIDELERVRR